MDGMRELRLTDSGGTPRSPWRGFPTLPFLTFSTTDLRGVRERFGRSEALTRNGPLTIQLTPRAHGPRMKYWRERRSTEARLPRSNIEMYVGCRPDAYLVWKSRPAGATHQNTNMIHTESQTTTDQGGAFHFSCSVNHLARIDYGGAWCTPEDFVSQDGRNEFAPRT